MLQTRLSDILQSVSGQVTQVTIVSRPCLGTVYQETPCPLEISACLLSGTKDTGVRTGKREPRKGREPQRVDSSCCRRGRPHVARPREKGASKRPHPPVQPRGGQRTRQQAAASGSPEPFSLLQKGKGGERL